MTAATVICPKCRRLFADRVGAAALLTCPLCKMPVRGVKARRRPSSVAGWVPSESVYIVAGVVLLVCAGLGIFLWIAASERPSAATAVAQNRASVPVKPTAQAAASSGSTEFTKVRPLQDQVTLSLKPPQAPDVPMIAAPIPTAPAVAPPTYGPTARTPPAPTAPDPSPPAPVMTEAVTAQPAPPPPPTRVDNSVDPYHLEGSYTCTGVNLGGGAYSGAAVITKQGATYLITYTEGAGYFEGVGTVNGDQLVVQFQGSGASGVVTYQIQGDGILSGPWTFDGAPGVGQETLTPNG